MREWNDAELKLARCFWHIEHLHKFSDLHKIHLARGNKDTRAAWISHDRHGARTNSRASAGSQARAIIKQFLQCLCDAHCIRVLERDRSHFEFRRNRSIDFLQQRADLCAHRIIRADKQNTRAILCDHKHRRATLTVAAHHDLLNHLRRCTRRKRDKRNHFERLRFTCDRLIKRCDETIKILEVASATDNDGVRARIGSELWRANHDPLLREPAPSCRVDLRERCS